MSALSKIAADALASKFKDAVITEFRDEHTVTVPLAQLREVLAHCKDDEGFDYLVDVSSVDNFGQDPRFQIVYELYSYRTATYLRIKADVDEDAQVPSVADLWATANWHEREVYDMMGLRFSGHPDLRRILMWDGYPYYPLRKDFPLAGKPSEMPDVAFTAAAPLAGGPFVTQPSSAGTIKREPRSREMD